VSIPQTNSNHFPTGYDDILNRIENIDPVSYGRTRNFIDGDVTRLSPYISRGFISTRLVMEAVLSRGYNPWKIEKFLQELAWRDYWQQVWVAKGDTINGDLKRPQENITNHEMPAAVINAETGIRAIDQAINEFYESGYLHNHLRMYTASVCCNIAGSHWKTPARWLYYHLLDGDWASNALSWQWVAGSNSGKKYYANQENINKYCYTRQKGTFLDVGYDVLPEMPVPEVLSTTITPDLTTPLPEKQHPSINPEQPVLVYNHYNLDPLWHKGSNANRILLLEPSHFEKYPVSAKTIDFVLALGTNIPGLQIFNGEFDELKKLAGGSELIFREHPAFSHYSGTCENREWMFTVTGYFPSFFAFWKKCRKELGQWT
jgi:deoxyribodipyrimidine photo-lyase